MKTKLLLLFITLGSLAKGQYTVLHNFNDTLGANPGGNLILVGNKLYGMTSEGGTYRGCIFSIDTNGDNYKDLFDFNDTMSGYSPFGSLLFYGNRLFGMTYTGGTTPYGTIFSIDTNGAGYKVLLDFNDINGGNPHGSFILIGNKLYGITANGAGGYGNIFSIDTNGANFKDIYDFSYSTGYFPQGTLTFSRGKFFGTTTWGGLNNVDGTIFSVDTNGTNYKVLLYFNAITNPCCQLILSGHKLFGMTEYGGAHDSGTIFSIDTSGGGYKDLFDFNDTTGYSPEGSLTLVGDKLYGMCPAYNSSKYYGNIFSIDTDGSRYNNILIFNTINGGIPYGSLTVSGNDLYGMTEYGGTYLDGVIFKIDTNSISTASINNLPVNEVPINVYPNPSNGIFTLSCHSERSEESNPMIEVYNVLGEKVYSQFIVHSSSFIVNLNNQPNGIYLYRVISENGNLVGEGKLVIQR